MQFRIECTKNNLARSRTSACCCTRCQDNSATKWACKYQHLLSIPSFLGASFVYSRKSITVPNTKVASFPFILGTSNFLHTDKLCLGIDLSTSEADTGGHKPDFTLTN